MNRHEVLREFRVKPAGRRKEKQLRRAALDEVDQRVHLTPRQKAEQKMALVRQMSEEDLKKLAVKTYRRHGTLGAVAKKLDKKRSTIERWMMEDPEFMEGMVDAHQSVLDELEGEALQRARDGSDDLLKFLLRANRPDKFRETGPVGGKKAEETNSPSKQTFIVGGQVVEF